MATNASSTIFELVLSFLSPFFHDLQHFSSHAKDLFTIHLFGINANVCNPLCLIISTSQLGNSHTVIALTFVTSGRKLAVIMHRMLIEKKEFVYRKEKPKLNKLRKKFERMRLSFFWIVSLF